ncbi:FecR domain-containing protein [Pedobacter sp. PLR]|uniref:FecR family protein n=1 Tax=Pedobacter sp. PLR TaxID=2994465 RepID=UPI002248076F|nr:FecR family protein [Pedobacter sp. PLR]MCX2450519.1 FecR domain-containing protein [Pedobacter sp. PLR]
MEKTPHYLLQQFQSGSITAEERKLLSTLIQSSPEVLAAVIAEMMAEEMVDPHLLTEPVNSERMLASILSVDKSKVPVKRRLLFSKMQWASAAAVFLIGSIALYFYLTPPLKPNVQLFAKDIAPAGNQAVLTLADGKTISLTAATGGAVIKDAGISITKTADGKLVYEVAGIPLKADNSIHNTIATPKGGQWQIHLPDGTMVWINAESSLTYPVTFSKLKTREVTLKGEAYFEVAKDADRPFIVHNPKQDVQVLGTHFNINAYPEEGVVRTTLLEGSVRVLKNEGNEEQLLKPGEQSVLTNAGISVTRPDLETVTAWKDGYFMFNNEKQESIMRKISRWYNVEVVFADPAAKDVMYYGTLNRFDKVSKILDKLGQTGEVRYEVLSNKIVVYKQDKRD